MERVRRDYELNGVVQDCNKVEEKREKGVKEWEVFCEVKNLDTLKAVCRLRNISCEPVGEAYVDNSFQLTRKGHTKQTYRLRFLEPYHNDNWRELMRNILNLKETLGDKESHSDYFPIHLCDAEHRESYKRACDALHWSIQFIDADIEVDRKGYKHMKVEIKRI